MSAAASPDFDPVTLATLAPHPVWVAWQAMERNGKVTKVPFVGLTQQARANARSWIRREIAERIADRLPKPHGMGGIGIEFTPLSDGRALGGIDLDSCRDPQTGRIEDWALAIIERFDSYAEVSPSETGAKIFLAYRHADLPRLRAALKTALWGRKFARAGGDHPPAIEVHLGHRYFAVTERILDGMPHEFRLIEAETLIELLTVTGPAFVGVGGGFGKTAGGGESNDPPDAETDAPRPDGETLLFRINGACGFHPHLRKRWGGDWTGIGDLSGSGKAFTLAAALKRAGFGFDDTVAALHLHAETREWAAAKGEANGKREFQRMWDAIETKPRKPGEGTAAGTDTEEADLITEGAVSDAFTAAHQERLRYDHTAGRWFLWDGTRWRREETRLAFRWAHDKAKALAADTGNDRAIIGAGKASFASGVERLAQSDRAFAVVHDVWDRAPWLLGTPGGVVDLKTGEMRPAAREDFITKLTAVAPAETAECPQWLKFLKDATGDDQDLIGFLKRWFGYSLTGVTREHALVFVFGGGGNGKGVAMITVFGIMGGYAANAALDSFVVTKGDKHPTDMAMLAGARLVMTTEVDEGQTWAEARIKSLTGGDPVTARFMRQDFFTFTPQFKLTISGNNKPGLRTVDDSTRRRFNMVPFTRKPEKPDHELPEKLKTEWPGILRWMIQGCLEWQREGLNPPKAVNEATKDYFEAQDTFGRWLDERCIRDSGLEVKPAHLLADFMDWCRENGEETHDNRKLRGALEKVPGVKYGATNGRRWVRGIGLKVTKKTKESGDPDQDQGAGVQGGAGSER